MSRTAVAALAVAGALALSGLGCGCTPQPAPIPFGCSAQVRGAVSEDLWCFAGTFDYTQFPDGGLPVWALNIPLYRGTLMAPEVAGEVGFFVTGTPAARVAYGWNGTSAPNVDSGGALREVGFVPPVYAGVATHEMVVPLSWPDLSGMGRGTLSVTFSVVPGPADPLGAHGVVDATLPPTASGGFTQPVTLRVAF